MSEARKPRLESSNSKEEKERRRRGLPPAAGLGAALGSAALGGAAMGGTDRVTDEANRQAGGLDDVGEAVGGVAEFAGEVLIDGGMEVASTAAEAAAEVGGEVVGGAMEALGSGLEVAGGCAEGCSLMVAFVLLLAFAGTALACGWF